MRWAGLLGFVQLRWASILGFSPRSESFAFATLLQFAQFPRYPEFASLIPSENPLPNLQAKAPRSGSVFLLPSFAVELKRNVQNGVTNSDLGALHCHSEFISESNQCFMFTFYINKMLKQVQHDGGNVLNEV